jgi:glycosyltransferase involved in cell wall biosynthesis
MRVVHIIKVAQVAGAESHLLTLLPGLRQQGFDAQLIVLVEPNKPMADYLQAAQARGIPAQSMVIRRDLDFGLFGRLRRALRDLKPRVVHTHLQHADLYGMVAARLARVPVVITSRHNENIFRRRPHLRLLNRQLWRLATAGIAISQSVARFALEVEGAPARKVHTVYYGLPHDPQRSAQRSGIRAEKRQALGLAADALVVGMACRLVQQKGVSVGLRAFRQIAAQFPTAHLVIVGDGPLRSQLQTEAHPVKERVHFLGWRDDVADIMTAMDVFLMPSLWEGFGLAALEAMAQRLPVIASEVSSLPEIVAHQETGLLVPPQDMRALADALALLLADRPLRQHMGLLGEDRAETLFGAARMVEQTAKVYRLLT